VFWKARYSLVEGLGEYAIQKVQWYQVYYYNFTLSKWQKSNDPNHSYASCWKASKTEVEKIYSRFVYKPIEISGQKFVENNDPTNHSKSFMPSNEIVRTPKIEDSDVY